jgi:hypothetical protein
MTKLYTPYEAGVKILERVLEIAKAEKNTAHVVEAGIEPKKGLVKKKGFGEESSESKEHEEGESKEEESAEHEEGSEESSESEAHEQSESPAEEKEEHKEESSSKEEQPKKKMNFFAKKPEMKKSETVVRKSPVLEFLAKNAEKGINLPSKTSAGTDSKAGASVRAAKEALTSDFKGMATNNAIKTHKKVLGEIKDIKPNLPKSENENEDESKELDKSAIRARKPTSLKVALRPKKQPVH